MLNQTAMRILDREREIDLELVARMGFESIEPVGGSEAIGIPYFRGGEIVNHKYRTIQGVKKFWQDEGAPKILWNVDVLADETLRHEPLIVTEGEFDALAAIQAGARKVVSVPDGAPAERIADPDSLKYSYLDAAGYLRGEREIIIATDGDAPGRNLMNDLAIRLGKGRCKWIDYPDGCKDLNDVMKYLGQDAVNGTLRGARWFKLSGLGTVDDFAPVPDPAPYSSGMSWLDGHYKLRLGDFTVVTGIPGHGKTTWLNDLACRMADIWGWSVCHCSFEQPPRPHHQNAIRHWRLGKPWDEASAAELARADDWIRRLFVFVAPVDDEDDDGDFDLDWLLERAKTAVVRHGCKLVIVDPWNEIEHARPFDVSPTDYTGAAIRRLKRFARTFNVHLIVVTHPTKLKPDKAGKIPIPTLYDIADSAHWANKPDVGIVIHRDRADTLGRSMCRIAKSRDEDRIGRTGQAYMAYSTATRKFEGVPGPDEVQ